MTQDAFDMTLELSAGSFFLLPGTEYVTYFPASGAARRMQAVIFRSGEAEVLVKNSADGGIASTEVNTGGDKMELDLRAGKRPVTERITEIIDQDAGMMRLKVM